MNPSHSSGTRMWLNTAAGRTLLVAAVVVLTGATFWYLSRNGNPSGNRYRFVSVEQGDLEAVVSSTGTLGAVTTVQVGTQVSGIISKIFVDFNDHVEKGQVIALIDTTLLGSAVREAVSNLERNRAQLRQAERELKRIEPIFKQGLVAEIEFNKAQYDLDVARASTRAAETSLERAWKNLEYATIYAPISGTVIERNVDVGQTVAASFSAPQLFLIANDLSRMQILASVDESDIGRIQEGQEVRFTVQAYPDEEFRGTVRQVRLQSTMQENVVNYGVVVDVRNDDGRLLPGMTATVDFLIETAENVLKIPNSALRFRPSEEMIAEVRERMQRERDALPDSARQRFAARRGSGSGQGRPGGSGGAGERGGAPGESGGRPGGGNFARLWRLDEGGKLAVVPVRTGITDGQMTEIQGPRIEPGMQIIAGVTESGPSRNTNPFQSQQGQRRPGGF